jgi:hypothetical protein
VVVEQEVAVEDAAWAVVAAAVAVVAVEEDVVVEASDQPTIKTRTKNNHCLEATSTSFQNCPGTSRRPNRHPRHQLCPDFMRAGYPERPSIPTVKRLALSSQQTWRMSPKGKSYQQGILQPVHIQGCCFLFTFMSFRKKKMQSLLRSRPYGLFPFSCPSMY